jgi:hypothetical protein
MQHYFAITIISTIVWLIIPFVYRHNRHFYYFLFLGLNDFIGYSIWYLFSVSAQALWIPTHVLILITFDKQYVNKTNRGFFVILIPIMVLSFFTDSYQQKLFVLITHSILFLLFVKIFVNNIFDFNKISFFYLVLIFYELINVFKIIAFMGELELGLSSFVVGSVIQIIIGLYLLLNRRISLSP